MTIDAFQIQRGDYLPRYAGAVVLVDPGVNVINIMLDDGAQFSLPIAERVTVLR